MQWTPSGPTADCVASNAVDSHVSGLTVANGRLFVAQFQLGEWSLVDAHAIERLPLDFSADFADGGVYHTGKHAQNLWISSTLGTLFEFTDGGFVNRTPTAEDLPDMDADIISTTYLESDFDQLYTIARYRGPSSPDSTTDRWLRRTGTGWQALAELPSPGGRQLQYAISSAAPTGLFAVVDNRVWYHGQSSTDWIDLTDGLPDGEVTSVEAGEDAVYVTVGGHGVWKRAY